MYRALLGRSASGVVQRSARGIVVQVLAEQLAGRLSIADDELDTTLTFLSWGIAGMQATIAESGGEVSARTAYNVVTALLADPTPRP